jgi:hypothetical protein
MPNIFADLHSAGYVVLPQKISVPKIVVQECRSMFAHKKVNYTFNGPTLETNDKKRYVSNIDSASPWLKKIHDALEKNKVITNHLQCGSSSVFLSVAGCAAQPPHSDYLKTDEFVALIDSQKSLEESAIKKGDSLLYTKDSQNIHVSINQVHKDDYPNLYYTIMLPDGSERQTTFKYLAAIPDTEDIVTTRRQKIPIIVLTAIMDNTCIDVWENSHNWMRLNDNQKFDPPIVKKTVNLKKGQICVLRGDIIHAGAAYAEENIRIYCFYDSYVVLPPKNKVYLIGNQTEWAKEIISSICSDHPITN